MNTLLALLFAAQVSLSNPTFVDEVAWRPAVASGCTVDNDSEIFDYTAAGYGDNAGIRTSSGNIVGIQFDTDGMTVTQYRVLISSVDTAGTIRGYIASDSSDSIGSEVSDTSVTVNITEAATVDFTLASPKSLSSGTYWVVFAGVHADTFVYTQSRNWGLTHRIFNASYSDSSGMTVGLYGCE